ncbi:hypothetical protein A3H22_03175 [Candidatus Peribacteria bacterium RIFCSPLOWO2_12_FULL_55_15]|nr:MAG: hypothetical protein A2789_03380 [Candidatus Peribacteria bacterium RIFCSPHIGHO2_01_FULL_54_22]OGJ63048.1 MAG: hypothetical protein A3D12_00695 [Candidatus Peribacteria bacterium RIFCSPHIGHO2_02_FULL_55_24]OGJ71418.1 MAG: hypothetical protein A3H22_03175 [Candidatus Peribacteria bacterium RIFCSPLOWO2_12_FULL_55_15]
MDISHVKKFLAGTSAVAMMLTSVGSVFAAYRDVAGGVWYEDAVNAFVDAGYLDASQTSFRGGDAANRAEFVKLVVELNGGILSTAPAVASFNDVGASAWYYGYFEEAAKEGWVKGDKDCYGTKPCYARPSANINRAEAAALIVRAFGLEEVGDAPSFVDNPSGQWYTDVVQTAADHCVLQGDDKTGRARPRDNMNRAEMVVMLNRVDQGLAYGVDCGVEGGEEDGGEEAGASISDVRAVAANKVEVEFSVAVDSASAEEVSHYTVAAEGGDEMAVESATAKSADVVELMMAQSLTAGTEYTLIVTDLALEDGDLFSDTSSFAGYSSVVKGDGVLEASVSASNPAGDSLPKGSQGVSMLSLDITASCDDAVVVEDLTVIHQGFGDEADITGIYAAIDGARVTRKRTIDAEDQTADLRFSLPLTVPACGTKTVDVVADFLSTATTSGEHNLAVELPTDFISNAKEVRGNFPMVGNSFKVAAVTSGKITLEYRTISPDEVEVGDVGMVVGKWEFSTDAVEDQTIYSLTLEQNSSASDGDFTNIKLRRTDGTVLTNIVNQTVGDYVTLVFDPPFTILEGDKITLEIIADIAGGAGDKIIMHFEESSDIFAVGSLYGYGVNGQLYGSQVSLPSETSSLPDTITIGAGEFTVEIDGPPQQKYTRDDKDAVIAKVKMLTGGEAVDIKDLFIAIQGQTSSGVGLAGNATYDNIHELLEDVEIRNTVTGRTVSAVRLTGTSDFGTGTAATATYQIYRFDDLTVKGDEVWEFRVDFIDNGTGNRSLNGDKFRIHICTQESVETTGCTFGGLVTTATTWNMKIEGLSTGDSVTDVRPGGTVTGNFHRIATPELTVAVKGLASTDTAVKNAKNVNLYRFEARASESKDILLTKAIFDAESGSLLNGQNYALWVDTNADSTVDTILEKGVASQSSKMTFQQLAGGGYVIPKEQTVVFEVHGDISASLTTDDLLLKFATGTADQASYLEVEEADDGSSLSGIKTNGTCQTDTDATAETNCSVVVTTARSTLWALVNQGNLFVSKDTTPVRSRQLLGGSLGDAILRVQFRAENEDVDVTDMQLTSSGSTATSVDRLELYKEGDVTPFAEATIGGCGSDDVLTNNSLGGTDHSETVQTFCANMESRQLLVKQGQNLSVIIRPRLKSDIGGAISNQVISFFFDHTAISNEAKGSGSVRARGMQSNNNLDANSGDSTAAGEVFIGRTSANASNVRIAGERHVSALAKIASIVNASRDANDSNVPTGPEQPIGMFKFTAASHANSLNGMNNIVLSGVIFSVNSTNVVMNSSGFYVYNYSDATRKVQCYPFFSDSSNRMTINSSGSFIVECKGLNGSVVNTTVGQGASATFVLEGNVTNAKVGSNTSSLQVSLGRFTSNSQLNFGTHDSTRNYLTWLDEDTTTTIFYWIEYPETVVRSTSYKS